MEGAHDTNGKQSDVRMGPGAIYGNLETRAHKWQEEAKLLKQKWERDGKDASGVEIAWMFECWPVVIS